jgi:hypothetical protein
MSILCIICLHIIAEFWHFLKTRTRQSFIKIVTGGNSGKCRVIVG